MPTSSRPHQRKELFILSIGKLDAGAGTYYLDAVADGIEDYYLGGGEAPGTWVGTGAEALGLSGRVGAAEFTSVLAGVDPIGAKVLVRSGASVGGFDATFSAPKSVSLLYALGEPDVAGAVIEAHEAAVADALGYLQRQASAGRRGAGGARRIDTAGFIAGAFRHRMSRAGDPDLHTHVVVANLVRGTDGRWGRLDARALYAQAKTAGYLYQAALRHGLATGLGVQWSPVRKGQADLVGIDAEVRDAFSQRRNEITTRMASRGEHSAKAAQAATLDTRRAKDPHLRVAEPTLAAQDAKDYGVTPADAPVVAEWRARAEALGLSGDDIAEVLHRHAPANPSRRVLAARLVGPEGLTAQASTFSRRDVVRALAEGHPQGATVAEIETAADALLASDAVLALVGVPAGDTSLRTGDVIRRADGRIVGAHVDTTRYSTTELLAAEAAVVDSALSRHDAGVGRAEPHAVAAAIGARLLGPDQEAMVRHLTTSGAGVDVVVGRAGTGKTYALGAAREAWESSGYRVLGAALAARAARQLQDDAEIASTTLDRLLIDVERGTTHLDATTVIVVDEAAMVGTRKLARLLAQVQTAGAKVVLVGDHHQLPEIDAGGAFRGLHHRIGHIELTENRRQEVDWEQLALAQLRHGQVGEAIAAYESHGRVRSAATATERRQAMIADWVAARDQGQNVLMVAYRRADVAALNAEAQARRRGAGELGPEVTRAGRQSIAVGDEVMLLANHYDLGVRNGDRATVTADQPGSGALRVSRSWDAERVDLPASYLSPPAQENHTARSGVTLGYAATVHKAQGATADLTLVLAGDDTFRELAYVGASRGRVENRFYLVAGDETWRTKAEARAIAVDGLTRAATRSRAKTMASDEVVQTPRSAPAPRTHRDPSQALHGPPVGRISGRGRPNSGDDTPRYLRASLGERPEGGEERGAWDQARAEVDGYRRRYGVTDPTSALGRKRGLDPEQQVARERADASLRAAQQALSRVPEQGMGL